MEEIKSQVWDDELNKAGEEIHKSPRHYIPVPKVKKDKKTVKQNCENES